MFGITSNSIDINAVSDFDLNSMNRAGITASDLDINATNIDVDGSDIDITATENLDLRSLNTLNIDGGTIDISALNAVDITAGSDNDMTFTVVGNSAAFAFKKGSYEIMSIEGTSSGNKAIVNILSESQKGIFLISNDNDCGSIKTSLFIEKVYKRTPFVRMHKDYLGNTTLPDTFVKDGIFLERSNFDFYSYMQLIITFFTI